MTIALLVEGETERVFKPHLVRFLNDRIPDGLRPKLKIHKYNGRIPKSEKLLRVVENFLRDCDYVIALTDVYTGTGDFTSAADAKEKMRKWAGGGSRFHPHVALHDFEAWLLPYWEEIQSVAGHNRKAPAGKPETVNHGKPPSKRIEEIFRTGTCKRDYLKPRDAKRILDGKDLNVAIQACPELRAFVNTILRLCECAEV